MNTPDDLSQYYAELLEGIYDCVDRIVLNAFFPMGQTGGGMRSWWRNLHGYDSQLDDKPRSELARHSPAACMRSAESKGSRSWRRYRGIVSTSWPSRTCPRIRHLAACSW